MTFLSFEDGYCLGSKIKKKAVSRPFLGAKMSVFVNGALVSGFIPSLPHEWRGWPSVVHCTGRSSE